GGPLVGDAVVGLSVAEGVRSHARRVRPVWLVLDDQGPSTVHVVQEPGGGCAERGARRVGAGTDHDRVEAEQVKALKLIVVDHVELGSKGLQVAYDVLLDACDVRVAQRAGEASLDDVEIDL